MARKIAVEIVGDASSLERAFKKSERSASRFNQQIGRTGKRSSGLFGGLTKTIGLATGALGVAGLAGAARAAFQEMADAEKVTAQTNAAIKSTGGVANVTAEQVDTLANSLLNISGVDDEVIKGGENMLLTFTNIRNEVGKNNDIFDQATKTALDMSVALGQDMRQSALQLGKALNDPIKGVGALRRVGVAFTNQQQDQIKALVKTGHTLEAQKLILAELNKEFGGSARAAGQTLSGQLNKLRNTALNLGASLAQALAPSIRNLLEAANKWLSNSKNQKTVLDTVKAAAGAVTAVIKALTGAFKVLNSITGSTKNTLILLGSAFVAFKALKMAAYVNGLAKSFRGLAGAEAAASAAGAGGGGAGGGGAAGMGKFGRALGAVGAVAVGAPLVAAGLRKIPGFDKTFRGLGGAIAGATVARGGGTTINIEHVNTGARNSRDLENDLVRRSKQRSHSRRATR